MISLLALTVLIIASMGYGLLGLRLIRCPDAPSWAENFGRAYALGVGTLGWIVFWFGITGFIQTWILLCVLLPGILSFWFLRKNFIMPSFSNFGRISGMLVMILMVTVIMDLLEALAPPADADTLAYHFALPKQFLKNGIIEFIPIAVEGAIPLLTHMTYLLALGLGGEISLTLWTFTFQMFMALTLYGVARRWLSREWSLALILVFLTTPAVIYGGGSGHMEIRVALYMLIGAMSVTEGVQAKSTGLIILSGLMAGFFMGSKYYGLFAASAIGTVVLLQKQFWRPALIYSGVVILIGTQWYGWNWFHSGMPVFPALYHFMGSPESPYWNEAVHQVFQQVYSNFVCVPANLFWLIWYPFVATFNPASCFDSGRVGLGPFLLMLSPGILYGLWYFRRNFQDSLLFKLSIPIIMYYVLWFLIPSNQMTRHLLPIYPILLIGATVVIHHLALEMNHTWGHLLWKMSATICILMGLGVHSVFTLNYANYHLTQETRGAFYMRNVGYYNVLQWINKNLSKSDRIANPIRYLNYLLEVPYYYLNRSYQVIIDTQLSANIDRFIGQLNTEKISHIIDCKDVGDTFVNRRAFHRLKLFQTVAYRSRTLRNSTAKSCIVIELQF